MSDDTLYLYTSLTAGSSHIVTATARVETILKANKLPFKAIDVATDDGARKLWGRRSKGKKLPGLVRLGNVVGDLEQIEDWNEHGELRDVINNVEDLDSFPATTTTSDTNPDTNSSTDAPPATPGSAAEPKQSTIKIQSPLSTKDETATTAMRQAGQEAALKAKATNNPSPATTPVAPEAELKLGSDNIPQPPTTAGTESEMRDSYSSEQDQGQDQGQSVRRPSIPEIAGNVPHQRPVLAVVPEVAAVSSGNIRADNVDALGLVEHHRGSIVSATSDEEMRRVARDVRQSVSQGCSEVVNAVRGSAKEKGKESFDVAVGVEEDKENGKENAIASVGTAG